MVPGAWRKACRPVAPMLAACWWPCAAASGPPGCFRGSSASWPRRISRRSSTSVTTWSCTACTSVPISTPSPTPWPEWTIVRRGGAWPARAGPSWHELARLGGEDWFRLGDRDLATHLFRTERLRAGETLSSVTADVARRRGIAVRLLPVTDDPLCTRVTLTAATELGPAGTEVASRTISCGSATTWPCSAVRFEGADKARPAPGVLDLDCRGRQHRGVPVEPDCLHRAAAGGGWCPRRPGGTAGPRGRRLTDHRRRRLEGSRRPPHGRARHRARRWWAWLACTRRGSGHS